MHVHICKNLTRIKSLKIERGPTGYLGTGLGRCSVGQFSVTVDAHRFVMGGIIWSFVAIHSISFLVTVIISENIGGKVIKSAMH